MSVVITKEYLDTLPEETILMIRDYIWNRFGKNPATVKNVSMRESKTSKESALRRKK
jgi:hypothetical protein